ncbi:MAG: cytochrome P450 [Gemmatimonas sp.]
MIARWQDARANVAAHPIAWPVSRLLARTGGLRRVPGLGFVVNDAAIAHEILCRDRDFTKNGKGSIATVLTQAFGPAALSNMDGDAHRSFRQRLGGLADATLAQAWLASSEEPFTAALTSLRAGSIVDLSDVARALSGRLTLTLLGATPDLPSDALDAMAREVHALGERIASALQLSPLRGRRLASVLADHARLLAYAETAFARQSLPPDSLVARLKALHCSPEETRGVLSIFFVAGALTLGVAIPRLLALIIDSGQLRRLQADPSLVANAVDEGLRFICPVPATVRIAARDTKVGGRRVPSGCRVVIMTSNCARDSALFPNGNRFDVSRMVDPRARYMWFGAGPHFCLGFVLAQRTLAHVVRQVAALPGTLRVVRRSAARGVLLPAWSRLELGLDSSP